MSDTRTFGRHTATTIRQRGANAMAVFTRGLQAGLGNQWKFTFPNGFGASVIDDGYGAQGGLYELAVLGPDGKITYDTPLTNDVLGYLTDGEVGEALDQIEALPAQVTA